MRHLLFGLATLTLAASGVAHAEKNYCGDLANAFGPFDYRKRGEYVEQFRLVESAHFTEDVERGIKGSTGHIGGDLDYTLRAIPNHPRALATMAMLAKKNKTVKVTGAKYPVECYFERASRFQPNDGAVQAVYANYQFSIGQDKQALQTFKTATEMSPDDATINYNAGLAYLKAKDYQAANKYAQKAYALGFPLPYLKTKLVEAGKWVALPDTPAPEPDGAAKATSAKDQSTKTQ